MTFDLQLWVTSPLTRWEGAALKYVRLSGGWGKALQVFLIALQRVKCCGRFDPVLRSFLFKSKECVCDHKNKNVCGEVHRWRGRWVQTLACGNKNNPTELPPVVRTSLNAKKEPECVSEPFFFFEELHPNLYCLTTKQIWTVRWVKFVNVWRECVHKKKINTKWEL